MKIDEVKKDEIIKIINDLNENKINYSVIRNIRFLETREIGSDIDISLKLEDRDKVDRIFVKFGYLKRETNGIDAYYFKRFNHDGQWLFFHFLIGKTNRSVLLNSSVAESSIRYEIISVPLAGHYLGLLILREIRNKGNLKFRHLEDLEKLATEINPENILRDCRELLLLSELNENDVDRILYEYQQNRDQFWEKVASLDLGRKQVPSRDDIDGTFKKKFKYPFKKIRYLYSGIKLLLTEVGEKPLISAAIVGVDGAGKSTFINNLNSRIPAKLPLQVVSMKGKDPATRIGRSRIKLFSLGKRKGLYIFNYIAVFADWLDKLYRFKNASVESGKKGKILLFDRWSSDTVVYMEMKKKYSNRLVRFAWFLEKKLPKPDYFIFLDLRPHEAFKRKQENTIEELKFRYLTYKKTYTKFENTFFFDASVNPGEITEKGINFIMKRIKEKQNSVLVK